MKVMKVLQLQEKYVRGDHSPSMNKSLSKRMVRTKLDNIFLKNRNEENKINYIKQRNSCVTLLGKSGREYYRNFRPANLCKKK